MLLDIVIDSGEMQYYFPGPPKKPNSLGRRGAGWAVERQPRHPATRFCSAAGAGRSGAESRRRSGRGSFWRTGRRDFPLRGGRCGLTAVSTLTAHRPNTYWPPGRGGLEARMLITGDLDRAMTPVFLHIGYDIATKETRRPPRTTRDRAARADASSVVAVSVMPGVDRARDGRRIVLPNRRGAFT